MRMTNDRDQALLRSAVADTAANLLAFLPSLGTGEAFAFGEGMALPTRLKFKQMPARLLPKSEAVNLGEATASAVNDRHGLAKVIERWRGHASKQRPSAERAIDDVKASSPAPAETAQASPTLDPTRFKLLKGHWISNLWLQGGKGQDSRLGASPTPAASWFARGRAHTGSIKKLQSLLWLGFF